MEDKSLLSNVGFILSSRRRYTVLKELHNKISTPTLLATKLDFSVNHISNILRELLEKNLVFCETPLLRKGRIYNITKNGKLILKKIKDLEKY
jgi:ArsR family transcriptional regulator, cadmium/lead-responsive transcriptional repressor